MIFDISVSGPDVMLAFSGRSDGAPVNLGTGFGYLGVLIPVDNDGRVQVEVTQGGKTGFCEQNLLPLEFETSPLKIISAAESGGKVEFKWTWKNLYKDEVVSFDGGASLLSKDFLTPDCVAAAPSQAKLDDAFNQEVTCTLNYNSDFSRSSALKSIRYKNQKFAWHLSRGAVEGLKLQKEIVIDLIRNSPALPVIDPVIDPEACKPIPGTTGFPFSHVCDGAQSVFGLAGGVPAACRLVGDVSDQCR